jgi:hypothetical protein
MFRRNAVEINEDKGTQAKVSRKDLLKAGAVGAAGLGAAATIRK